MLRNHFLSRHRIVLAAGIVAAMAAATHAETQPQALSIGQTRQLFLDQTFLGQAKGLELVVHQPVKTGEFTIKPDHPWEQGGIGPYSSVLKEGDTYHMWYHAMATVQWDAGNSLGCICYARSKDGIRWEKPELGITEFGGSKANNIVMGHGAAGVKMGQDGGMVFIDPNAPTDQRYRMFIRMKDAGEGVHIYSSGDGAHWTLTQANAVTARPQEKGHHLDSQNVMFWDERLHKYVFYGRKNVSEKGSQGRSIARGESPDFKGFGVVQDMPVVMGPDQHDIHGDISMVDYYMSAAIKYPLAGDAYFMFPTAYYHYVPGIQPEFTKDVPTNAGPLDTQFAASRDGVTWNRFDRRPFLPLGMKGEFDWASARMIHGIVADTTGRFVFMYYRGSDWLHGGDRDDRNKRLLSEAKLGADQNIAVLSRVILRRDGFVSVRAGLEPGEFTTPPLVFAGSRLRLNVDTSATGVVRVEVQEPAGAAIKGYSLEDCDRMHTANEISRVVRWKGQEDVSSLAGKPVRLRFVLRCADLYAFEFAAQ